MRRNHFNVSINEEQISAIAMRIFDTSSYPFRKGQIRGWKNHFAPSHIAEFKELAGFLLIELGYEKGLHLVIFFY